MVWLPPPKGFFFLCCIKKRNRTDPGLTVILDLIFTAVLMKKSGVPPKMCHTIGNTLRRVSSSTGIGFMTLSVNLKKYKKINVWNSISLPISLHG